MRVTDTNKRAYVDLVAAHRLTDAIRPQLQALLAGFALESIAPGTLLDGAAVDIDDAKLDLARRLGASVTVNAKTSNDPAAGALVELAEAVVLLLLLLLLARRRKAQQEAEKHLRMARALSEEQEFSAEQDLPESSFEGLETPAASVKLNTPAPAPAPAAVVAPVVMAEPIAAPLVAPSAERSDDVLDKAQSHINAGRLNQAAALLEAAGWKKGADGIRAKGGTKLKFVFQTSVNKPRQDTQAIVKSACSKAGRP